MKRRVFWWLMPLMACVAHWRYSWMGFNPTDDGFVLAQARRLLAGQVPHRDFISIRPVGSALLYCPALLWGGQHAIWSARLEFWLEWAVIGWCWSDAVLAALHVTPTALRRSSGALLVVLWSSMATPLMVSPTVDALCFISAGLCLSGLEGERPRTLGCLLAGGSLLCKQSFVFALLAMLVVYHWRQWYRWAVAMLPMLVYALVVSARGAGADFVRQMLARSSDLAQLGVWYGDLYRHDWGDAVLPLCTLLMLGLGVGLVVRAEPDWRRSARAAGVIMLLFYTAAGSYLFMVHYDEWQNFPRLLSLLPLAALLVGLLPCSPRTAPAAWQLAVLVFAVAWTLGLTLGSRTPAALAGPAWLLALMLPRTWFSAAAARLWRNLETYLLCALVAVSSVQYDRLRHDNVYRQPAAARLSASLEGVFPGAAGLYTDDVSLAYLQDLRKALQAVDRTHYGIVPDFAGYWACADAPNPLPLDWVLRWESPGALEKRFNENLLAQHGSITLIVERVRADAIYRQSLNISDDSEDYPVVGFVRQHFDCYRNTAYFQLYH